MFHRTRLPALVLGLAVAFALPVPGPAAAATAMLVDTIAPGVLHGVDGFGTATVLVPKGTYVTYLIRTDSHLKGKRVQIWTDTGKGWQRTTTRSIASDGSVHYFALVSAHISFWAKYVDTATGQSVASHGRRATPSRDGSTVIALTCDDFAPTGSSTRSVVSRTIGTGVAGTVRVVACSNASTGFQWSLASIDGRHLLRVGHSVSASTKALAGAPGTETWSFRDVEAGTGRATLVYSQPWRGGEKAAWTLMLTIQTA
jgi:predicted secreted protein